MTYLKTQRGITKSLDFLFKTYCLYLINTHNYWPYHQNLHFPFPSSFCCCCWPMLKRQKYVHNYWKLYQILRCINKNTPQCYNAQLTCGLTLFWNIRHYFSRSVVDSSLNNRKQCNFCGICYCIYGKRPISDDFVFYGTMCRLNISGSMGVFIEFMKCFLLFSLNAFQIYFKCKILEESVSISHRFKKVFI